MSHKGMTGSMGWAANDKDIVISLTKLWNELGEECGFIYSYEDKMPEHLQKLLDAITSVRNHLNKDYK